MSVVKISHFFKKELDNDNVLCHDTARLKISIEYESITYQDQTGRILTLKKNTL